jgi:phage tail-like protein
MQADKSGLTQFFLWIGGDATGPGAKLVGHVPSRYSGNVQTHGRIDPYRDFRFRVKWAGRYVAGVAEINGLTEGGTPDPDDKRSPQHTKFEAITLKRGVTGDPEFARWLFGESFDGRSDLTIELTDEAGEPIQSFKLHRGWVSKIEGPNLGAKSNEVAIEAITLQHEGCERLKR